MADQHCTAGPAPARFEFFRTTHVAYQVAYTRAEVIDLLADAGILARAALTGLPDEELLQVVVRVANDDGSADTYAVRHVLANDSDDSHEVVETGWWAANLLADDEVTARR